MLNDTILVEIGMIIGEYKFQLEQYETEINKLRSDMKHLKCIKDKVELLEDDILRISLRISGMFELISLIYKNDEEHSLYVNFDILNFDFDRLRKRAESLMDDVNFNNGGNDK